MSYITFPNLVPDFTRQVTLSDFGISINNVANFENRAIGASFGVGTIMVLEYKHRTASEVFSVVNFYKTTKGSWRSFNLPVSLWRQPLNYTYSLSNFLEFNSWRFNKPISYETIKRDVYDFNIEIKSVNRVVTPPVNTFPCNI